MCSQSGSAEGTSDFFLAGWTALPSHDTPLRVLLSPFRDLELGSEQAPHRRDFRLEPNAVVSADVPIADKARRKHKGNHGQLCLVLGNHRDCPPAVKRKGSFFKTQTLGRVFRISDLWVVKDHGTSQLRDR